MALLGRIVKEQFGWQIGTLGSGNPMAVPVGVDATSQIKLHRLS